MRVDKAVTEQRRGLLRALGGLCAVGLAGCSSSGEETTQRGETPSGQTSTSAAPNQTRDRQTTTQSVSTDTPQQTDAPQQTTRDQGYTDTDESETEQMIESTLNGYPYDIWWIETEQPYEDLALPEQRGTTSNGETTSPFGNLINSTTELLGAVQNRESVQAFYVALTEGGQEELNYSSAPEAGEYQVNLVIVSPEFSDGWRSIANYVGTPVGERYVEEILTVVDDVSETTPQRILNLAEQ